MEPSEVERWKARIEVVRLKKGRTLTTAILHVSGEETPPLEILFLAAGEWQQANAGQVVRRPDEEGKQVYWVNALNTF